MTKDSSRIGSEEDPSSGPGDQKPEGPKVKDWRHSPPSITRLGLSGMLKHLTDKVSGKQADAGQKSEAKAERELSPAEQKHLLWQPEPEVTKKKKGVSANHIRDAAKALRLDEPEEK